MMGIVPKRGLRKSLIPLSLFNLLEEVERREYHACAL